MDHAGVDGSTALHWAVNRNDTAMTEVLLDAGADPGVTNRYGFAPTTLAATNGNARLLRRLISAGTDPRARAPGIPMPRATPRVAPGSPLRGTWLNFKDGRCSRTLVRLASTRGRPAMRGDRERFATPVVKYNPSVNVGRAQGV